MGCLMSIHREVELHSARAEVKGWPAGQCPCGGTCGMGVPMRTGMEMEMQVSCSSSV